ncbi:hypothetical protein BU26DRAFT_520326 [Trematosphaeria pertusa]|uniref:Nephrocystin 3-like N-terminal domain-containing protein n=1 Tax=Trematosphaeria pertusa TaxID=390896 RepID=A0A6A6I915_9PLEO|nr:uncharacterized protein BU26DRAFT_520326 [Trematosphaeria pertusa]KAF2247055.1 hypothetical protein BU26DRAFT_520326 [Trematosphaeria pertusa]
MAELLDRLPLIVQNCEDYAQIYPGKNTLRRRIEELYIQIVGAIEDMVRWYTQKASKRALKSVFSNDAYLDSLDKRIRDIDVAHDAFKEVAERYLHWQTALMQHNVAESHALTQETNENLKLVGFKLYEQGQQIKKEVSQMESRLMNGINDILGDHRKNAEWLQEKKECQQKIADQDARIKDLERQLHSKSFRAATLARRLHLTLPFDAYADDVQRAISEGIIRSTKFQTRSKQIAAAEEFRQWFTSDSEENALLCVNGNADQDSLSPTTFLAALLIQNLEQKEAGNVLVLRFFCGLHTNTLQYGQDHEIGGPLLLVRALVAQILNIDSIDDRHYLSSIAEDSVQAMEDALLKQYLATLSELLHRLRRDYHGVMIVIDGIEFYNTTEHRRATKRLIKSFANITSEKSAGGSLKVLLMAASDCSLFRRIGGFSVLDMPEDIECGGSDYESLGEL